MRVKDAVDDFLVALEAENASPATTRWYASILMAFTRHFDGAALESVTAAQVRLYLVGLRQRDRYTGAPQRPKTVGSVGKATLQAHDRALRGFWSWCAREYGLKGNPMDNVKKPRSDGLTPKAISLEDVARLLAVCGDDPEGRRDKAIIAFLLDTGVRAQSVFKLEPVHLDMARRRAFVQEKGRPARPVFFTERTAVLLASWLAVRPEKAAAVFCSLARHAFGARMTPTSLNRMLKRRAAAAGVEGPCNPHAFRHAYAREYLRNGGDLATLSRLMGHSDIHVTAAYYAVFAESELANSHRRFSPLNGVESV